MNQNIVNLTQIICVYSYLLSYPKLLTFVWISNVSGFWIVWFFWIGCKFSDNMKVEVICFHMVLFNVLILFVGCSTHWGFKGQAWLRSPTSSTSLCVWSWKEFGNLPRNVCTAQTARLPASPRGKILLPRPGTLNPRCKMTKCTAFEW